jgi:hypothetical protein
LDYAAVMIEATRSPTGRELAALSHSLGAHALGGAAERLR